VRLKGHHALITGGGTGIGAAIARALAAEGAKLTLVGRRREKLEEVGSGDFDALVAPADVTRPEEVVACFAIAREAQGPISILVNNAGLAGPFGPIGAVDPDAWWRAQAIHVRGTLLCMHAVLPGMRTRGHGRIINIASRGGLIVGPSLSAYCVAKATVIRLTEHVDAEAKDAGVRAFVVQPGTILTDMARDSIADPDAQRWVPFLVNDLKAISHQDPEPELQRLGRQVAALAAGRYDELAGAYLDLEDGRVA